MKKWFLLASVVAVVVMGAFSLLPAQTEPNLQGFYYTDGELDIESVGFLQDGTIYAIQRIPMNRKMCGMSLYRAGKSQPVSELIFCSPTLAKAMMELQQQAEKEKSGD